MRMSLILASVCVMLLGSGPPKVSNSNLRINVVDATGKPLLGAELQMHFERAPEWGKVPITSTQNASLEEAGKLVYLELPPCFDGPPDGTPSPCSASEPGCRPTTVTLTATLDGVASDDKFTFGSCEYEAAVHESKTGFAFEYTFRFKTKPKANPKKSP